MPPHTLVLVAARNEAQRIGATLRALDAALPGAVVFVADDGSSDETAPLARASGAHVLSSGRRRGKGAAMDAAARTALDELGRLGPPEPPASTGARGGRRAPAGTEARGGERARPAPAERPPAVVVLCDADLGACAAELRVLADAVRAGEADLAVAAFSTRAGGGFGIALRYARRAVWRLCGFHARAPLSGQRALTADALRRVLPFAAGYGMETAMTIDAVRAGLRVREVELALSHRATRRTPRGFAHRARQLLDVARACRGRRRPVRLRPWLA